jgi:iron complex outermembrane recepter protein
MCEMTSQSIEIAQGGKFERVLKLVACGCSLGLALGLSQAALAQATTPTAPSSIAPDTNNSELGEIVVTAMRREESIKDVPISITALSNQDLANAGISDIRDLGNITPGLVFTSQAGFASPEIRGVQSQIGVAGAEQPTAIYIDGVYQPNPAANIMDIGDVDNIEVLKGPQGTLFGRNATAGAIIIHTVDPTFETKGDFTLSNGVYSGSGARTSDDVLVKGYVTGPLIGRTLAGALAGSYEYVPGYLTDDINGSRSGEILKYDIRAKLLLEPTDDLKFLLIGSYVNRHDETVATQPLRGNTVAAFYPDAVVPTEPYHVASPFRDGAGQLYVTEETVALKADWDFGEHVGVLTSHSSYLDINVTDDTPVAAAQSALCVASFNCVLFNEGFPSTTLQQELNFTSAHYGSVSFVAGALYYHDSARLLTNLNPPLTSQGDVAGPGPVLDDATVITESYAGFGEATFDATQDLHLIGGIRYSSDKSIGQGNLVARFPTTGPVVNDATTPRASIRYDINPQANVYFTYSQGFKSAVLDSSTQGNDVSKPEKLTSYEVGTKIGTGRLVFSADAFYYDYRDLQVQFFNGEAAILTNAPKATIWGFEGDSNIQLSSSLNLHLTAAALPHAQYDSFPSGVAYALPNSPMGMTQVPVDASGHRMLKTPKLTASASLNYVTRMTSGDIDYSATYSYVTNYFFDLLQRVDTGNYGILNGTIGYSPTGSGVKVSVFAKNLTGKVYFSSAVVDNESDGVTYAPPREIGVEINYRF